MEEPIAGGRVAIAPVVADAVSCIAADTFSHDRQLIVFVSTKRGAESQAERVAGRLPASPEGLVLAERALKALSSPTKQCRRLAKCLGRGVAFHHAGLHAKQREIVEEGFRSRVVRAICATPTLAAGVDLPAFRVVIRDLKRYGGPWGMTAIPVLEYEQMAGRAGRPGKDPWGEAICLARDEEEASRVSAAYLHGAPEEIYSKLAVEPVLRTYVLSLVASGFITGSSSLHEFFDRTFYAHQYGDTRKLRLILDSMVVQLREWEFLKEGREAEEEFVSASELSAGDDVLEATPLGVRVSELYLDPYTAHHLLQGLRRSTAKPASVFSFLHLCASTLELRPYVRARQADLEAIDEKLAVEERGLLHLPPSQYSDEYDQFLDTVKTSMLLEAWMEESDEESLLSSFGVRPGELHAKLELIDWLVYAASELAKLTSFHEQRRLLLQLRLRLKHGAKEELLPLLRLREVGRVRARKLFQNGVRDVAGVQRIDPTSLAQLVGKAVALKLKEQVGQRVDPASVQVRPHKRKGQRALGDWG